LDVAEVLFFDLDVLRVFREQPTNGATVVGIDPVKKRVS
jgi:hypothetical protein